MGPHSIYMPTWPTIFVAGVAGMILFAYTVRMVFVGRYRDQRVDRVGGTPLLGRWFLDAFYWIFRVIGRLLVRLGVSPDALTWTSLIVTALAVPSAAMGHFTQAGLFVLLGSCFDAFDGIVARERGIGSDSGEALDAVIDRVADAAPLAGLALFYRFSLWQMAIPLAALVGSFLLSYVRAKAEALDLELPSGLMRRHERITYLIIGLVIGPELTPYIPGVADAVHPLTLLALGVIGLVSWIASAQLLFAARRELVRLGRGPKEEKP